LHLNPRLLATALPPIPEAKAWVASYDGAAGPLIDLSQAVPGYPAHSELLARLGAAAATAEAASYGDIAGDPQLRASYAEHVSGLYAARVAAENVAVTAGCNQAFYVAMIALAGAGDSVMLPSPWYFNHKMTLDMLGIESLPLPCRADAGFIPQADDARSLLRPNTRAIVLVTPSNPTGAIYPPPTIAAFQNLAQERGIALVIDETYRDFLPSAAPPHAAFAAPDWGDTVVQLYSFSKSYCIPGHRLGAMIAAPRFIDEVVKILDCLQICASRTPQLVLPWAIPTLADWRAANRAEILARADAFRAAIGTVEGWSVRSIGAYFAYLEHPYPDQPGAEVAERLARERGVLCLPGAYFGPGQEAFLRVAFANVDAAQIGELPARLRLS
jgi:aspartate/methionine/tyrosine aminotransferase